MPAREGAAISLDDLPLAACMFDTHGAVFASNERGETALLELGLKKPFILSPQTLDAHPDIAQALTKYANTSAPIKLMRNCGSVLWLSATGASTLLLISPPTAADDTRSLHNLSAHMAAALAHEIRNPLLSIKGAATLLKEAQIDSEDAELAQLIYTEAARVEALMQTLDPLSASASHSHTSVNIHEVLEHALRVIKNITPDLAVTKQYDPSIPEIHADASRLIQVFINLLHNACDAMKHAPVMHVHISTRIALGAHPICISIRDQGEGVPEALRDTLFMPFVSGKAGGKGLGLSIAEAIVQQHCGMLSYNASEGGGSEFTVQLPLKKAASS